MLAFLTTKRKLALPQHLDNTECMVTTTIKTGSAAERIIIPMQPEFATTLPITGVRPVTGDGTREQNHHYCTYHGSPPHLFIRQLLISIFQVRRNGIR
ncbi:hypothetical protein AVEN_44634-1 [Araneus ventricosus]|uniref:Uncharacterized protein n=1 Tax=Araneus ventricosus TaxID=182803 RepID=A0A4Y2Q5G3_ARAVE|nr:hypothetical protein AVEN_44634-1 [Araneus ventricosus]